MAMTIEVAPENCSWSSDKHGSILRSEDGFALEFQINLVTGQKVIYVRDDEIDCAMRIDMLCAFVDHIRANGETDL